MRYVTLKLHRGDRSNPRTVENYEDNVGLAPGIRFRHDGEVWVVDRVTGSTLHCKLVPN